MKNYPFQTFLFWKTADEIQCRRFMDQYHEDPVLRTYYDQETSRQGITKTLVLDGQQRLQSLFFAYAGSFGEGDLYIDLASGDEEIDDGVSYRFDLSTVPLSYPMFRVNSLREDRRNANDIADDLNEQLDSTLSETGEEKRRRERLVRRNVGQLVSILREDTYLWVDELDGTASDDYNYQNVLNIFVRVNSGGTKLEPSDLLFAVMKEAWTPIEQEIEDVVTDLNRDGRLSFDKTFALKAIMVAIGESAILSPKRLSSAEGSAILQRIQNNWDALDRAFAQLQDFIHNELQLYSDKVVRSYNALVPIVRYFYMNPSPSATEFPKLKAYYYCSQMFNWFSARTDQVLNACAGIMENSSSGTLPLTEFKSYFARQGRQTNVTADSIDMRLRFIVLNLLYVEQFGTSPFHVRYKRNEPHIDHIFPKSKLKELPTSEVNHIGNYRYCGASENLRKRAQDPSDYFQELKNAGIDIQKHLLVDEYSENPAKLTFDNYEDFRSKRTKCIVDICKRVMNL